MSVAKAKRAKAAKAKKPNDTALIKECVIYAQSIAAFHNGFKADPDGNNTHADALGDRHHARAEQALTKIAATPAKTPDGLCSKRIAAIVFEDNEGGCFEDADMDFLKSFAAEVKQFLQPICDGAVKMEADTPGRREERESDARIRARMQGAEVSAYHYR